MMWFKQLKHWEFILLINITLYVLGPIDPSHIFSTIQAGRLKEKAPKI
jgi:hypothetical protein